MDRVYHISALLLAVRWSSRSVVDHTTTHSVCSEDVVVTDPLTTCWMLY